LSVVLDDHPARTCKYADVEGHKAVLKWARENDCPEEQEDYEEYTSGSSADDDDGWGRAFHSSKSRLNLSWVSL
jgi:hypothetical protein